MRERRKILQNPVWRNSWEDKAQEKSVIKINNYSTVSS